MAGELFNANSGTGFEDLTLSTTKGAAQTTKVLATTANNSTAQSDYIARFTSDPLAAQTVNAPGAAGAAWTIAIAASESNVSANAFLCIGACYIWRPGTSSVVGALWDANGTFGLELTNSEDGTVHSRTTAPNGGDQSAQAGDVLVWEVWMRQAAQAHSTSYNLTIYFDGTTDVVDATSSDAASYIETPQTLTFAGSGSTYTKAGFGKEHG